MKMIFLLMALVMAGCGSVMSRDLSRMPSYDSKKAESQWEMVSNLDNRNAEIEIAVMEMAFLGGNPTESEQKKFMKLYDEYLYWRSVTVVEIFHGDDEKAEIASHRANESLNSLESMVKSITKLIGAQAI